MSFNDSKERDTLFGGFSMVAGTSLMASGDVFLFVLGSITLMAGWGLIAVHQP